MIRPMNPFDLSAKADKAMSILGNAAETLADLSCTPIGHVSGAVYPFRVDIVDTENCYELFADLAGFTKEQITVSYSNNDKLEIKAEREEPDASAHFVCHERRASVSRSFALSDVDTENVHVTFTDGVLHVVLPKTKESINKTTFSID